MHDDGTEKARHRLTVCHIRLHRLHTRLVIPWTCIMHAQHQHQCTTAHTENHTRHCTTAHTQKTTHVNVQQHTHRKPHTSLYNSTHTENHTRHCTTAHTENHHLHTNSMLYTYTKQKKMKYMRLTSVLV